MDPISTIGGVVGFAAQVLKTSKTIYDFIKSVRESPEEFRQLAEELETISAILKDWTGKTKTPPNLHIINGIKSCQLHLKEVNELASQYQLQDGLKRGEKIFRGFKGTLAKKKVQELQTRLESTKSTLTMGIGIALHSDVQLLLQEVRTLSSRSAYLSSSQSWAISMEGHRHATLPSQTTNTGAIEEAVESVSLQLENDSHALGDIACIAQRHNHSTHSSIPDQNNGSPITDAQLRRQVTNIVRDEFESLIRVECQQRLQRIGYTDEESGRFYSQELDDTTPHDQPTEYKRFQQSHHTKTMKSMSSPNDNVVQSQFPSAKINSHTISPPRRIKTKWMRRHDTFFGILMFRCDIHAKFEGNSISHAIKFSFTLIPKPQFASIIYLYSMSVAQNGWNRIPTFNSQQYNIVDKNMAIFSLIENNGEATEIQSLLMNKKASPFDVDLDGWTPLHWAVRADRYDLCKMLIAHGSKANIDLGDGSPLAMFFKYESTNVKILRLLLSNGADPCQLESIGTSPFYYLVNRYKKSNKHYLLEMLRFLIPYRGLNDDVAFEEDDISVDDEMKYDDPKVVPWSFQLLLMDPLNYIDILLDLGANFVPPATFFNISVSEYIIILMTYKSTLQREENVALLKKSINVYPSTHHILSVKLDNGIICSITTTALAIEMGYLDIWLEAMKETGENIDKFLEDDFKILQAHGYHLRRCDEASCRERRNMSSESKWLTCWDWYFGGFDYTPIPDETDDESESEDEDFRVLRNERMEATGDSWDLECEKDLLGGALRSQLGEFVPEIDSERFVACLFLTWFLSLQVLAIEGLVNPISSTQQVTVSPESQHFDGRVETDSLEAVMSRDGVISLDPQSQPLQKSNLKKPWHNRLQKKWQAVKIKQI